MNNVFANRTVITGANIVLTASNVGATKEPGEPDHAGNSGGASVWWSWTAPYSGFATISTAGRSFDTVLGVYTGSSVSALTWVDYNDDEDYSAGIYTSKVFFDVTRGQNYQIAVDGFDGDSRPSQQLSSSTGRTSFGRNMSGRSPAARWSRPLSRCSTPTRG